MDDQAGRQAFAFWGGERRLLRRHDWALCSGKRLTENEILDGSQECKKCQGSQHVGEVVGWASDFGHPFATLLRRREGANSDDVASMRRHPLKTPREFVKERILVRAWKFMLWTTA